MGLIDSINRLERVSTSAKQEQRQERERKRREREQELADKRELAGAKAQALEGLETFFSNIYSQNSYEEAHDFFLVKKNRDEIVKYLARTEADRFFLSSNYSPILAKIDKIYKNDKEANERIKHRANVAQSQQYTAWQTARVFADVVLAFLNVLWRILALFLLAVAGFYKLADCFCKPPRRRGGRY